MPYKPQLAAQKAMKEDDAFVSSTCQASLTSIPKEIFLRAPCHLRALAAELNTTFMSQRAKGASLDIGQDTVSFRHLNKHVNDLLKAYSLAGAGDWRRYAAWNDHSYLRHLLLATDEFEVMLLCWRPGQTSRVHTHANSHCWFSVLDGRVRETQYPPMTSGNADAPESTSALVGSNGLDLKPTLVTDKTVGDVAYINDNIAMHSLGCCSRGVAEAIAGDTAKAEAEGQAGDEPPALACTLHVYCPPIRRAKALEGGRVTECNPGFFSRHCILAA